MWVGENWGKSGDWGIFPNYAPTFLCKVKVIRLVSVKSFGGNKMNLCLCCECLFYHTRKLYRTSKENISIN